MKRFFACMLAATMMLLCCACGNEETPPADSKEPVTTTTATTAATTAVSTTPTAALPEMTDKALVEAVDLYMRITAQNDVTALQELPVEIQSICAHPMEKYAQYMSEQPFYGAPEGTQWHVVSVENPFGDNSFDVVVEYDGEEQTLTMTKEGDVYIIDELMLFFDSMTYAIN